MATMGGKLWEAAKSPTETLTYLLFGLFALLGGFVLRQYGAYLTATPAMSFVAAVLGGIGAFFITVALFLGAFGGVGDSNSTGLRIAALVGAVAVLLILL